jgi:glucose/arabinose dehydrogenase
MNRSLSNPVLATGFGLLLAASISHAQVPQGQQVSLKTVATGLTAPNWGTPVPGCPDLAHRLVVTDQPGILWAIDTTTGDKTVLLDVSARLVSLGVGGEGTFDERGLLGVALHPQFAENGLLYTYTSEPVDGEADFSTMPDGEVANHQSVVNEWQVTEPCLAESVVDPATVREVLRVDEPQFNHDCGALAFGPDGMLHISLGDGGAADDQGVGHVEGGNGQDPGNVLGSILRIDPQGTDAANGAYGIPADNPFVGDETALPEVFAFGLRNPFRISFDTETGALYIADVGQNDIEEINLGEAGANYGWNTKEGTLCFDPNGDEDGFAYECGPADDTTGLTDPIAEYNHDEGVAVVGGFVYRGEALPELGGHYVFGDYFHPASMSGRLFYLDQDDMMFEFDLGTRGTLGLSVLGFGQDATGEVYVMANMTGTPFGDSGQVLRIGPPREGTTKYAAKLSGRNEVPPNDLRAKGKVMVKATETALHVKVQVIHLDDIVAAHIHCAPEGVNGPVGLTLFADGPESGNGMLVKASFTAPDPGNACGWASLDDVVAAIEDGNAYVNVHTLANPPGAIRGQLH